MIPFLLVLPCFRESQRVGPFLDNLRHELSTFPDSRVLLVDDGSGLEEADKTDRIVESKRVGFPALAPVLRLDENLGKGGAVYAGWNQARPTERMLAFVDADGATPASEARRLLQIASESDGRDAIFASRVKMLGKTVNRLSSRHYMGRVFATLVSTSLKIPVYDSQCGLKIVPASAYQNIRSQLITKNFAFDVDLLANLVAAGVQVREEPVNWSEIPGGKVRIFRDSLRMFREVRRIAKRLKT